MDYDLLRTKLYRPAASPNLVERSRLIQRLNDSVAGKLTLVCAPAGFGKSSLVSQWLQQAGIRSAWLSLDEEDNDLRTFLTYVIAALQTADEHLGEVTQTILQSPVLPPIQALVSPLVNDLLESSEPLVLVLDEYHVILSQDIHEFLTFLLSHQPPQLHLLLMTRHDPPLSLARLRAEGLMQEIRGQDLRFDNQETRIFFENTLQSALSNQQVETLLTRTEGWIAGLQLAGLALQRRQDKQDFIERFAGTHSYIVDYLGEEVLSQQSTEIRDFLLKTAILDRFDSALCDEVTETSCSHDILNQLRQANLFLIPLDHEQRWYRYHHLFSDFLRFQLNRLHPELISELHRRASHWYDRQGWIEEAIHHALAGEHFSYAADLIESVAQSMIGQSRLGTVNSWIKAMPENLNRLRPYLPLYQAWALNFSQNPPDIEPYLQDAEGAHRQSGQQMDDLVGQILLLRGYRLCRQGNPPEGIPLIQQSLNHLADSSVMPRSVANLSLGIAYWMQASFALAEDYFKYAVSDIDFAIHGTEFPIGTAAGILADVYIQCGRLSDAKNLAVDIDDNLFFRIQGRPLAVLGYTYARLAKVLYEHNQLEDAIDYLSQSIEMAEWIGDPELLVDSVTTLALVQNQLGKYEQAEQSVERVIREIEGERIPNNAKLAHKERLTRAFLQHGSPSRWLADIQELVSQKQPWYPTGALALARFRLHNNETANALALLQEGIQVAQGIDATDWVIRGLILQAVAYHYKRQTDSALESLAQALSLAEPAGYIRSFVDEGPAMTELLTGILSRYTEFAVPPHPFTAEYAAQLNKIALAESKNMPGLLEPLTDREMDILRLIAAGLSNPEIADKLVISVGTVKQYNHAIYRKLDVHSRTEAIERAKELHLI